MSFWNRKKENKESQQEPKMVVDRFADMEQELAENNPERAQEVNGARYIPSPILDDEQPAYMRKGMSLGNKDLEVEKKPNEGGNLNSMTGANKPHVFSSGRDFSKQLGQLQDQTNQEERIKGMPVVPKSKNQVLNRNDVKEDEMNFAMQQLVKEQEVEEVQRQNVIKTRQTPIPEAPLPENIKRTAHGFLVSVVMNEQQFQEYCKGNKSVLKIFPVLAETPEKAANLMESKKMIPIEVFDYNFFKAQVERVEQLARENNIVLLKSNLKF